MPDLTKLELLLLILVLLELRALPETIIIGCKTAQGRCFLILTRYGRDWEKTLRSKPAAGKTESTGTEGTCGGVIVKFSKGINHEGH